MYRFIVLWLILILFSSCSLIKVDTCYEETFLEIKTKDWPSCQKMCDDKGRPAYGGILYYKGKEPEFHCVCGYKN